MAETFEGDMGARILAAVQSLGVRMDKLESRMDSLEASVARLESRMDRVESQVQGLSVRMDGVESQGRDLSHRMERQERLMESLGAEFIQSREGLRGDVRTLHGAVNELRGEVQQVRTEMREGFLRLNARADLTDGTVVLMASVLRRPTDLGEDLEKRLRALEAH